MWNQNASLNYNKESIPIFVIRAKSHDACSAVLFHADYINVNY